MRAPFFVTAATGTADLLAAELTAIGITEAREVQGGVACEGDLAAAYRACLESRIGRVSGAAAAAARIYLGLGDNARALSLLERAAAERDAFYSSESLAENYFDAIRGDQRFAAIVARVGVDRRVLTR